MTVDVARDAQRVFDTVRAGGVAIIPLDFAYATAEAATSIVVMRRSWG